MWFNIDEIIHAWFKMYKAKRWTNDVPSFRLESLLWRWLPNLSCVGEFLTLYVPPSLIWKKKYGVSNIVLRGVFTIPSKQLLSLSFFWIYIGLKEGLLLKSIICNIFYDYSHMISPFSYLVTYCWSLWDYVVVLIYWYIKLLHLGLFFEAPFKSSCFNAW